MHSLALSTDQIVYALKEEAFLELRSAALEVMSRYAVDPRWLIYLPPTMSPAETSARNGWLERPEEAFAYYGEKGVRTLVAEEKHMGSRGLIVLIDAAEAEYANLKAVTHLTGGDDLDRIAGLREASAISGLEDDTLRAAWEAQLITRRYHQPSANPMLMKC